jgi:hypothetical protein
MESVPFFLIIKIVGFVMLQVLLILVKEEEEKEELIFFKISYLDKIIGPDLSSSVTMGTNLGRDLVFLILQFLNYI